LRDLNSEEIPMHRPGPSALLSLLCVCLLVPGLAAQIPPRRTVVASAAGTPRIIVGNPMVEDAGGASPVELAGAMRAALTRIVGSRYEVVSRETMNALLAKFGYEADSPLSEAAVAALGSQLHAAYSVSLTLRRGAEGRLALAASVASPGRDPQRITVDQTADQTTADLAASAAEQLKETIK
jgi:hypothetical protein